jgi:hypothetical protein
MRRRNGSCPYGEMSGVEQVSDPRGELTARMRELDLLAGQPTGAEMAALAALGGDHLPPQTLSDLRKNRGVPRPDSLEAFVRACLRKAEQLAVAVPPLLNDVGAWQRLRERAATTRVVAPGHPLVRDVDSTMIGIHRTVPDVAGQPPYVTRAHDALLRDHLRDAGDHEHGMVVLTGRSTTGKTRSLWEAVTTELADWSFVDCRDRARLADVRPRPGQRLLIWLDDLRPTHAPGALAAALRTLVRRAGDTCGLIVTATTWPPTLGQVTEEHEITALAGDLAGAMIRVPEQWDDDERARANGLALGSRRLAAALRDRDFGPAQVLGGTPTLLRWWQPDNTRDGATAVVTAAVDLTRLGLNVLRPAVLRTAAYVKPGPGWRPDWFTGALEETTALVRDAVSALVPVPGAAIDEVVGYRLCDTLRDYGPQRRHWIPIPDQTWRAPLADPTSRRQLLRLAEDADARLLYRLAADIRSAAPGLPFDPPVSEPDRVTVAARVPIRSLPTGLPSSSDRTLADELYQAKDLDGLRALALPSNDTIVRRRFAWLLNELGLVDELLEFAVYSRRGARTVAETFAREGRLADLLRQVVCGNGFAVRALRDWPVSGLDDDARARLLARGLNPDGSPA